MTIPHSMSAIIARTPGGAEVLELQDVAVPAPAYRQVIIKVAAAGVNRPDVLQRQGLYPAPKDASPILGLEAAGVIVAVGDGVKRFKAGDEVCALLNGGGYAQYCAADEGAVLPLPAGLTHIEAASLPETCFTVAHNVFERGGLKAGETLLVHGGASGIGVTAIQLAKLLGARVFTTVGSDEKKAFCASIGANRAINYNTEDFVEVVRGETGGKGVDVILDMVGGDYIDRNLRACAEDGRIVQIAFLRGPKAEVDFTRLMLKRITLTGSTLRARPAEVKTHIARWVEANVWPLLASGAMKPVIDSTFPLNAAGDAHRCMESNKHIGKIVLTV